MQLRFVINSICLTTATSIIVVAGARPAHSDGPEKKVAGKVAPTFMEVRAAAERGLGFVEHDAVKWRKERQCATCHQGTMTVWALSEAKSQGYTVNGESFAE